MEAHVDIISLNLTYRFDTPAPLSQLPGNVTK
jgi:hypothetical protein